LRILKIYKRLDWILLFAERGASI